MPALPFGRKIREVEIGARAYAPVEHDLAVDRMMKRVLDYRLDRCEAGAAGDEDDRLVRVFAQKEIAERPLDSQDLAALEFVEQLAAEIPAGDVPDMQVEQRVVLGRGRDRETAPATVLEQKIDVLAGQVLQTVVRGKLQGDDRDVGGDLVDLFDPAGQLADPDVAGLSHFAYFDDEVGLRPGDTKQRIALSFVCIGQRARLVVPIVDDALEQMALASAAGTIAAAIRNHQVGAHRRREHGLVVVAGERMLAGLYGNLMRHR